MGNYKYIIGAFPPRIKVRAKDSKARLLNT